MDTASDLTSADDDDENQPVMTMISQSLANVLVYLTPELLSIFNLFIL